jgi:hypothetical protein
MLIILFSNLLTNDGVFYFFTCYPSSIKKSPSFVTAPELVDLLHHILLLLPRKLELIILSACSTPGRDQRPLMLPHPIGIG